MMIEPCTNSQNASETLGVKGSQRSMWSVDYNHQIFKTFALQFQPQRPKVCVIDRLELGKSQTYTSERML